MLPCHLSEYILSLSMLDFRNRMGIALSRNIYNANGRIIVTYLKRCHERDGTRIEKIINVKYN